jgi:hypothetical protein
MTGVVDQLLSGSMMARLGPAANCARGDLITPSCYTGDTFVLGYKDVSIWRSLSLTIGSRLIASF